MVQMTFKKKLNHVLSSALQSSQNKPEPLVATQEKKTATDSTS